MAKSAGTKTGQRHIEEGHRKIHVPVNFDKLTLAAGYLLLFWVSGCVSPIRPDLDAAISDGWLMKARVGIKSTDKTLSFSLLWRQQSESFDIRLNGTLGVALAHVWGDASGVTIDVPGEGRFEADSASALLLQHTGLSLPIESLAYWVRGIPDPTAGFERADTSLVQYGWLIEYLAFKGDEPVRMRFSRSDVKIILVVSSWG